MSWKLQVAEMKKTYVTDQEAWNALHHFFYHGKTTTTYKYGFFKALLEGCITTNEQGEITYDAIFYSFTKIYWNLVIDHGLWQSNTRAQPSSVQKEIEKFAHQNSIPPNWNFEKLTDTQKVELVQKVKQVGKKYVIGALYGDFNGEIYTFDLKREYLQLHPKYLLFLQTYKRILTNVTNYQLALFLEKFNEIEKVKGLLTKVEFITERQSLKAFERLLQKAGVSTCFYCNKALHSKTHVDHFIPWSYFQNDLLWNFVLACPTCNSRKSDKLAAPHFLNTLIVRNEKMLSNESLKDKLNHYNAAKLEQLYFYAGNNGIVGGWMP